MACFPKLDKTGTPTFDVPNFLPASLGGESILNAGGTVEIAIGDTLNVSLFEQDSGVTGPVPLSVGGTAYLNGGIYFRGGTVSLLNSSTVSATRFDIGNYNGSGYLDVLDVTFYIQVYIVCQ